MKSPEEMRNTVIDVYTINGEEYLLRDDVRRLLRGEEVPVKASSGSNNRFDINALIAFKK